MTIMTITTITTITTIMRTHRALCALSILLFGSLSACEETPAGGGDAGVDAQVGRDAAEDAAPPADAGPPDAGQKPDGVQHDYCGQPFFKLHIGGEDEDLWGYSLSGDRLAYNLSPSGGQLVFDLYLLELDTCVEYQLTDGARATTAFIHGDEILWSENRDSRPDPDDYYCKDIYRYDLTLWREEQLTNHPLCEWTPVTNGDHIAFSRSTDVGGDAPREYLLWNRSRGTDIRFADPGAQAGQFDLSARWLAWSGYTQLATSIGKDVFVKDLSTGVDTHIETSAGYYCYVVRLDGEYLTYTCSEYWLDFPYHLFLRHLPTGEELELDGAEADVDGITHGAIHDGIVAWSTTKHMASPDITNPVYDVELYDIETGIYRRLTTAQSKLRISEIQLPWATFTRHIGPDEFEYYVGHLGRLGVLDADGRLIEGGPVLDPPQ
jgi:hypothetical protein